MKRILFLLASLLLITVGPSISRASDQAQQTAAGETEQQKEQYEKMRGAPFKLDTSGAGQRRGQGKAGEKGGEKGATGGSSGEKKA